MKEPGFTNFIHSQGEYQHTVKLSFKDPWYDKLTKKVEINLSRIIIYSAVLLVAKEVVIYAIRYWR